MNYLFKPEALLAKPELPFDFAQYCGDPDRFAGTFCDFRLRSLLGDPAHLEKARERLMELRRQSVARREAKSTKFGPYLRFRNDRNMVVIQDGRNPISTGIRRQPMLSPEDHPRALEELGDYIDREARKEQVLKCPDDIPLAKVFSEYLKSRAIGKVKPKTFQAWKNEVSWLIEFAGDKTLRYVDDDFGRHYVAWRMVQPARIQRDSERRELTMELEQRHAARAFEWLLRKLRKHGAARLPELDFTLQKGSYLNRRALTWTEFVWLLLACVGFQRRGNGFRTKTVISRGRTVTTWDLLPSHRTKRLIRYLLIYFCTGTRVARNQRLLWGLNDPSGSLDPEGREIWRSGRTEEKNKIKRAGRSPLTPAFAAIVRKWYRDDLRLSQKWGHPPMYVVHDGEGDLLPNIENLVKEVYRRAGLKGSSHLLKHTCVTLHAMYGYTHEELGEFTNTLASTLKQHYDCPWDENVSRRRWGGAARLTRLVDLKVTSAIPMLPEVAAAAALRLGKYGR